MNQIKNCLFSIYIYIYYAFNASPLRNPFGGTLEGPFPPLQSGPSLALKRRMPAFYSLSLPVPLPLWSHFFFLFVSFPTLGSPTFNFWISLPDHNQYMTCFGGFKVYKELTISFKKKAVVELEVNFLKSFKNPCRQFLFILN